MSTARALGVAVALVVIAAAVSAPQEVMVRPQSANSRVQLKLQPGDRLPGFSFVSIDDTSKTVTSTELAGKIYLVDFWATWCGPCVAQMPELHAVYDRFKDKGLALISVSVDTDVSAVAEFRKTKWPMPWFNAHLSRASAKEIRSAFEVFFVPRLFLVGRDGRIISTFEEPGGGHILAAVQRTVEATAPGRER